MGSPSPTAVLHPPNTIIQMSNTRRILRRTEQVQFHSIKIKNVGAPHTVFVLYLAFLALSLEEGNVREREEAVHLRNN